MAISREHRGSILDGSIRNGLRRENMGQARKEDFCVYCREVRPYSVGRKNIKGNYSEPPLLKQSPPPPQSELNIVINI